MWKGDQTDMSIIKHADPHHSSFKSRESDSWVFTGIFPKGQTFLGYFCVWGDGQRLQRASETFLIQ